MKVKVLVEMKVVTTYKQEVVMSEKKYNILKKKVRNCNEGEADLETNFEIYRDDIDIIEFDSVDIDINKFEEVKK